MGKNKWHFYCTGGEQYLTLGNFKNWSNTQTKPIQTLYSNSAGYYVDDVAVYNLDSFNLQADAGRDTTIHIGDSVFIGSYTNGIDTLHWQIKGIPVNIDSTRPGFWVKPLVNTCYVLTQTVNGYTSSDTVCVYVQPLPLKFISYSASLRGTKQSILNIWQTANEMNVSHFNIQRSTNGKDFITIGSERANNKVLNEYNFIDGIRYWELGIGNVYYRIEAIDFDGKKQYSEARTLNFKPQTLNSVSVYPNPAKDVVNIVCAGMKQINVINELGQTIIHHNINSNHYQLNISSLPKGIYLLNIINKQNNAFNEKLIVE